MIGKKWHGTTFSSKIIIKESYEMKVKKYNTFYNISFIDSMLEVSDINELINDELIRHKLLTEDDPPIISILLDIKI